MGHIEIEPNDTGTITLSLGYFIHRGIGIEKKNSKDTSTQININFRYKGKIYKEKLTCKVTFGRSKLIKYEKPEKLLNDSVAKFVITDENDTLHFRISCIMFKTYFTVKNTTGKPIRCTKRLVAWNDAGISDDYYGELEIIQPNATYKIPVQVNMDQKFLFTKYGYFLVCSEDIYEAHTICIKSTLDPKGDYVYGY